MTFKMKYKAPELLELDLNRFKIVAGLSEEEEKQLPDPLAETE